MNKKTIDQLCEKEEERALLMQEIADLVGQIGVLEKGIEEANQRSADLETFLFAFVWNRETFPRGRAFQKSEEEIADKTLEVMDCAKDMVDVSKMRERLFAAQRRRNLRRADLKGGETDGTEREAI